MIDDTMQDEERQLPCHDKLVFATREQAEAVAAVNAFRYRGAKLRAYACRYCHLWHLSSHYEE